MNLNQVASRFGRAYTNHTKAKERLAKQQKALFAAFDEQIKNSVLNQRTIHLPSDTDVEKYVADHFPEMNIILTTQVGDEDIKVLLEENPSVKKFTYVNREDGRVYGRTIAQVPTLDDEALRTEDPDLWEHITEWPEPWLSLVCHTVQAMSSLTWSYESLKATAGDILKDRGVERVLRPFHTLDNSDFAKLEQYLLPGPISVRLKAPRDAKPEELD